jgi:hypothetical protein
MDPVILCHEPLVLTLAFDQFPPSLVFFSLPSLARFPPPLTLPFGCPPASLRLTHSPTLVFLFLPPPLGLGLSHLASALSLSIHSIALAPKSRECCAENLDWRELDC